MEYLILLSAGAASGLIAGLAGFAGGIVVVPLLTWLYGPAVLHDAIVVSWFMVLSNSFSATFKQLRVRTTQERRQIVAQCRYYILGAIVVAPILAVMLSGTRHGINPVLVASLQLCLACVMLLPIDDTGASGQGRTNKYADMSLGGLVGGVSVLIGTGGGSYTIAYFVYAAKRTFQDAIATANITGLVVGGLAVPAYFISSSLMPEPDVSAQALPISRWGIALLIGSGVVFSAVGVRFSRRIPNKVLKGILVAALIVSALHLMMV